MELGTQGLLVSRRAEALLNIIYPSLKNYPRAEKYALCSEIKHHFYSMIALIEMANAVPSLRRKYAQEADGHLQTIKILIRLSRNQKYISKGFYRNLDQELAEINKLLSGYIKAASQK